MAKKINTRKPRQHYAALKAWETRRSNERKAKREKAARARVRAARKAAAAE